MPADKESILTIGRRGINVRDDITELHPEELSDSINWQIGYRGSLEKRLGFIPFGSVAAPADILEFDVFQPFGSAAIVLAYCVNGQVYSTTDGVTWTSIASGLSGSARPEFVQYLDAIYWTNGVDALRKWTGSGASTTIGSAPIASHIAVWRDRLWLADSRTAYWSGRGDPSNWSNVAYNQQSFPDWAGITGITAMPNAGASEDLDGLLVVKSDSVHRIVDDSDNALGVVIGGANQLVDGGQGFLTGRSIAHDRGRVYGLGIDGVYSTDGRSPLRYESRALEPLFHNLVNFGQMEGFCGVARHGRYYLALMPLVETTNSIVLELYLDLPANEQDQHPWMAHELPVSAWALVPDGATGLKQLLFVDSSSGDERRVRDLFNSGADTDGATTSVDILARARTGGLLFGSDAVKEIRKIILIGTGTITLAVSADGEEAAGQARTYTLDPISDEWGGGDTWNNGVWGPLGGSLTLPAYFSKRGRYLAIEVSEGSQKVTSSRRFLGIGSSVAGGAAVDALHVTTIPLDC